MCFETALRKAARINSRTANDLVVLYSTLNKLTTQVCVCVVGGVKVLTKLLALN